MTGSEGHGRSPVGRLVTPQRVRSSDSVCYEKEEGSPGPSNNSLIKNESMGVTTGLYGLDTIFVLVCSFHKDQNIINKLWSLENKSKVSD